MVDLFYDNIETVDLIIEAKYDNLLYDSYYFEFTSAIGLQPILEKYSRKIKDNCKKLKALIKQGKKKEAKNLCKQTRAMLDKMNDEIEDYDDELYDNSILEQFADWFLTSFLLGMLESLILLVPIFGLIAAIGIEITELIALIKSVIRDIKKGKISINSINTFRNLTLELVNKLNKMFKKIEMKVEAM